MADKPDKFPDWALEEQEDPVSGQLNRVEPPEFRKKTGWQRREIPPRQWFNWQAWLTGRWIRWIVPILEGLGSMATRNAGTGSSQFRTNSQNEDKFVTVDTAQTITQGKAFRRPGGSLTSSTLMSFGAVEGGLQYGLMLTDVAELPSNWPDFTVSGAGGEHIIRLRRGGTPASSNVRGFAIGAADTTPDFSVADTFGVVFGNPAGGFKGNGTINAEGIYVNGQQVPPGLGEGQSWQVMSTTQRSPSTTYTNTTGRSIVVSHICSGSTTSLDTTFARVDGIEVARLRLTGPTGTGGSLGGTLTYIVPPGSTYFINRMGGLDRWLELR